MTTGQHAARLLMIAALAICAVAWWRSSIPAPTTSTVPKSDSDDTLAQHAPIGDAPARRSEQGAAEPLPPANSPVNAIAATLRQRADTGDSRAACRLAAELIRCRQDAAFLAEVANPEAPMSDRLARDGKLDQAISLDERMLVMSQQQQACRALPEGLLGRAGHYLAQAARAGEAEAMILYIDGQHFPPTGMGRLADPGFDAWRRETPAMAHHLLQRGVPEAAFLLALAYGDDEEWFAGLMPDDAVLHEAHALLLRRLAGSAGPSQPSPLGADDLMRARSLAEDWHARHFDGRRFERSELTRRLTLMTHRRPESSPAPCEP